MIDFTYEANTAIKAAIARADGFEVQPVMYLQWNDGSGQRSMEVCEPWEADVWTVYAWKRGEGVQALFDLATKRQANAIMAKLERLERA